MEEEPKKPRRKTIYRIKKLLALANDKGATEGEAAEASRRAFALLAKWNLTLDSVERVIEGCSMSRYPVSGTRPPRLPRDDSSWRTKRNF